MGRGLWRQMAKAPMLGSSQSRELVTPNCERTSRSLASGSWALPDLHESTGSWRGVLGPGSSSSSCLPSCRRILILEQNSACLLKMSLESRVLGGRASQAPRLSLLPFAVPPCL